MVVASCMLNIHKCMIYHLNQNVSADAERYHTCLYVECTMIYDHICIPIFVCWIAVLPDFDPVENDQNLSKIAHTTKYHSKVTMVTL